MSPQKSFVIYGPNGEALPPSGAMANGGGGFKAADAIGRDLQEFRPHLHSADSAYLPQRNTIVAQIKDLVRNNGWASGIVRRKMVSTVGPNLLLSAKPNARVLGVDREVAAELGREIDAKFKAWAEDPDFFCDVSERQTLGSLAATAFIHTIVDGEALALVHWLPKRRGSKFATAIQLVDPDRLSNPHGRPDTNRLRGGIEATNHGRPIAFHFRRGHPGDRFRLASADSHNWQRIPAKTRHGRRRVIHFFEKGRAAQSRGISPLVAAVKPLMMIDKYDETELSAAIVNAILVATFESPNDPEIVDGQLGKYQEERMKYHDEVSSSVGGAQVTPLFPGDKLNMNKSEHPNTAFSAFETQVLHKIASAVDMNFGQLSMDYSKVNYSSARAAMVDAWRSTTFARANFGTGFMTQIYGIWLEEAISKGEVTLPKGAPSFWDAREGYLQCRWIGPARGWVDPVKEAQGAEKRMSNLLSTTEDELFEQGRPLEETLDQIADEHKMITARGLSLPGPTKGKK